MPEDKETDGSGPSLSRYYSTKSTASAASVEKGSGKSMGSRPNGDKVASLEAQIEAMQKRHRQLQTELSKSMKPGANGFSFFMVVIVAMLSFLVGMYMSK